MMDIPLFALYESKMCVVGPDDLEMQSVSSILANIITFIPSMEKRRSSRLTS